MRLLALLISVFIVSSAHAADIRFGVIAISGKEEAIQAWQPTIAWLQWRFPQHRITLTPYQPHEIDKIEKALENNLLDYLISQPAIYVHLEKTRGLNKILTLKKQEDVSRFGSVIFTRADSSIHWLTDIEDKKVAAVAPLGFGGWLIGYDTMKQHGIDPVANNNVHFTGVQEDVVREVLQGKADVGVIRTGIIEKMLSAHRLSLREIRILNAINYDNFPQIVSTSLYPEWALGASTNVSYDDAREIAQILLTLTAGGNEAQAGRYWQWTIPYNYEPVHNLMKRLKVGPYTNYGEITISQLYEQHAAVIILSTILLIGSLASAIYWHRSHKVLRRIQAAKENAYQQLEHLATHDSLTGIANRSLLTQQLPRDIQRARRNNQLIAVMYIDLNGFKGINDRLGHPFGDQVLRLTAKALEDNLRQDDLFGRLGGDEFLVCINNADNIHEALLIANKISKSIGDIVLPMETDVALGAAIGVAISENGNTTADELIQTADKLMYEVKHSKGSGYLHGVVRNFTLKEKNHSA